LKNSGLTSKSFSNIIFVFSFLFLLLSVLFFFLFNYNKNNQILLKQEQEKTAILLPEKFDEESTSGETGEYLGNCLKRNTY